MSVNILHISDFHFRSPSERDKNVCYSNPNFINEFISYINEIGQIDYLIFTGDAINQGYTTAFNDAKEFLNKIINELHICTEKVLLCMGNHDFDRNDLIKEEKEIPVDDPNRPQKIANIHTSDIKYKYFKSFVKDVCGKDLNVKDAIYDRIIDNKNKFILLGVNTCYIETHEDKSHRGAIDKKQFVFKMKELLEDKQDYLDYKVFLVMHHNPDPNALGNDVDNWKEILLDIQKEQISNPLIVFSGHIHYIDTSIGCSYDNDGKSDAVIGPKGTYYFSAGSLLNMEYKSRSFNLYEIDDNTINYQFHVHIDAEKTPFWKKYKSDKITIEKQDFTIYDITQKNKSEDEKIPGENKQIQDKQDIMNYIGRHNLYYSGHFHWNTDENKKESDFKSHGYIDINYLVSHTESLEIITRLFLTTIDDIKNQYKIETGKTLMVSIGMECNVIGARLSVLFPGFDFSYIPRNRKAKDHNDIEKEIGLLKKNDYDSIILIKDIMFNTSDGETVTIIRKLFYGKNVHIISLFYCGEKGKENEIIKGTENVYFHPLIKDIEIPRCTVIESECPIIKNKLQTIYRC